MEAYIHIGYIGKAHGLEGKVKVSPLDAYWEDFEYLEIYFIEDRGKPVPYFLEDINLDSQPPIAKFEDIGDREAATKMSNKKILIRVSDLKREVGESAEKTTLEYQQYIGYTLIDKQLGKLGEIEEIQEFPQQEMAFFEYNGAEKMIPLNEYIITDVDDEAKQLFVDLPEGLLSL